MKIDQLMSGSLTPISSLESTMVFVVVVNSVLCRCIRSASRGATQEPHSGVTISVTIAAGEGGED